MRVRARARVCIRVHEQRERERKEVNMNRELEVYNLEKKRSGKLSYVTVRRIKIEKERSNKSI